VERSAELLAYVEQHGISGLYLCVGTIYAARHQFHIGRLDRARHLLQHALDVGKQLGVTYGRSWAYAFLGDVEFVAGRLVDAKAAYAQGLELSNLGTRDEQAGPLCLIGLAHLLAITGGAVEEVRGLSDEALRRLDAVGNRSNKVVCLQRYAEALEELGDAEGARVAYDARLTLMMALGVTDCDFWPRVVLGQEQGPVVPRHYWLKATSLRPFVGMGPEGSTHSAEHEAETVIRDREAKA